jgi:organic radical activating enzyme
MKDKLLISSDFYSVQGEGVSSGIPSYFVRLGNCNLTCGMSRAFANKLLKEASLADGEIFKGDLELEGKATWTCDSTSQWLWRGVNQDFDYLIKQWSDQNIYSAIRNGTIHIIWTGGEPTIKGHQEAINNFTEYWRNFDDQQSKHIPGYDEPFSPYYEIETNGTIAIEDKLFIFLDQINCSPKLSNSGMSEKQRINPTAIKRIMEHDNYQFKFVISTEDDVKEIFRDFIEPFNIPLKNVVCMPGLDSQTDFHERTQFVLEMAKKYMFRGLTRLHISAWDRVINV